MDQGFFALGKNFKRVQKASKCKFYLKKAKLGTLLSVGSVAVFTARQDVHEGLFENVSF